MMIMEVSWLLKYISLKGRMFELYAAIIVPNCQPVPSPDSGFSHSGTSYLLLPVHLGTMHKVNLNCSINLFMLIFKISSLYLCK